MSPGMGSATVHALVVVGIALAVAAGLRSTWSP
jgi:hypothetical protein